MYDMDVLKEGEVGGYCKLNKKLLDSQIDQMSALQSWAPELRNFVQFDKRPLEEKSIMCDQIIKTPTFLMKIDASNGGLMCDLVADIFSSKCMMNNFFVFQL